MTHTLRNHTIINEFNHPITVKDARDHSDITARPRHSIKRIAARAIRRDNKRMVFDALIKLAS